MTTDELLIALNDISKFSSGACVASGNRGFEEIYIAVGSVIDSIKRPLMSEKERLLDIDISALGLAYSTKLSLNQDGIKTIRFLIDKTEDYLLNVPNLRRKCIEEIKDALRLEGLSLKQ